MMLVLTILFLFGIVQNGFAFTCDDGVIRDDPCACSNLALIAINSSVSPGK